MPITVEEKYVVDLPSNELYVRSFKCLKAIPNHA